jgi:hypothetical protein
MSTLVCDTNNPNLKMQILDCLWTVFNATIKIVLVQKQFNVAEICCETYVTAFEA